MAAPVIGSWTPTTVSSGTLHTPGLGSPSAGDLLIVVSSFANGSTTLVVIDETFSGSRWNKIYAPGTFTTGMVCWKIAEGGGADALRFISLGAQVSTHMCMRVTGHGSAVASAFTLGGFLATNADSPNVAITGAAQDVLFISAACFSNSVTASAAPASYSNLTSQSGSVSVSVADRAILATTSDNPGAFTSASSTWIAFSLAIPNGPITTNARDTQEAVEVLDSVDAQARVTQEVIEVASSFANNMSVTQVALEVVTPQGENLYATQVAVEVLSGDPWPSLSNPNKYRQIQIAC